MSRSFKLFGSFIIGLMLLGAGAGAYLLLAEKGDIAQAAGDKAIDEIRMASTRDFLYASHPQCRTDDDILITAHLYKNGQPIKKAGIPVEFSLGNGMFATLDETKVYTDDWGTASTHLRSYASGRMIPAHPFPLNVTAKAEGLSSPLPILITRHISLNGTVTDRSGHPVEGATVSMLSGRTGKAITAMGGTTTTDARGKYSLERVPTDIGNVTIYVKKGGFEARVPADFSGVKR